MIELINLSKSFKKSTDNTYTKALSNINLFIQKGEIFGIIGKSGAGKSTLLRSINLLERPDIGNILIDNENLMNLNPKNLRQARHKMAMIFQDFNLLRSKNVYANIALPMKIQGRSDEDIQAKIKELLTLVELENKQNAYPGELSGGQKQRVAIARALSTNPKILLCDEATSSLDPETTDSILKLLKKINKIYGITIVLITHEMDVVKKICSRLAVMEKGEIIETIAITEIFNHPESYAHLLLYNQLNPELPSCLSNQLSMKPNNKPLLRLLFQGKSATLPFISTASRELNIDINILLANIDRFDTITCGVLVIELNASKLLLEEFIQRCKKENLTVEILGYVTNTIL